MDAQAEIDISVVAVSWNTADWLPAALEALPEACAPRRFETVVVDNGSTDGSLTYLHSIAEPGTISLVALGSNTGFTHAANVGAARARGRYLLFLNPDVLAPPGAITMLSTVLDEHPEAWACTPWFRYPDGRAQHFWRRLPDARAFLGCFTHRGRRVDRWLGGRADRSHHYRDLPDPPPDMPIESVGAACLLVRRDAFEAAGRFDERYFNFFQDTALQRRMHRRRVLWGAGSITVSHQMGVTFARLDPATAHGRFLADLARYADGEPLHRRLAARVAIAADLLRFGEEGRRVRRAFRAGR